MQNFITIRNAAIAVGLAGTGLLVSKVAGAIRWKALAPIATTVIVGALVTMAITQALIQMNQYLERQLERPPEAL